MRVWWELVWSAWEEDNFDRDLGKDAKFTLRGLGTGWRKTDWVC